MFDWQTEDETDWVEETANNDHTPAAPKRRWLTLLLTVVIFSLVIFVFYQAITKQGTDAVTTAEQDVLATQSLVVRAYKEQDTTLLNHNLSGRDTTWASGVQDLGEMGWGINRPPFGLMALGEAEVDTVWLNPDLTMAVVTVTQQYEVDAGISPPIQLTHAQTYRRGINRWLLAPPEIDEIIVQREGFVTINFPQQDQPIVNNLSKDIYTYLNTFCDTAQIVCPPIYIHFSTHPQALLALQEPEFLIKNITNVTLPTPSLVGTPADEIAYQHLKNSYLRYATATLINTYIGNKTTLHEVFYKSLLELQLAELDLIPPPDTATIYTSIWQNTYSFTDLIDHQADVVWDAELPVSADNNPISLIQFARTHNLSETAIITWMQQLHESNNVYQWLSEIGLSRTNNPPAMYTEWFQFIRERAEMPAHTPPIPLPQQDLAFLCDSSNVVQDEYGLYQLNLASENLQVFNNNNHRFQELIASPDGKGIITLQTSLDNTISRFWQDTFEPIYTTNPFNSFLVNEPNSPYLIDLAFTNSSAGEYEMVDVADCEDGKCRQIPVSGYPQWSPDKQHTILTKPNAPITIGDSDGNVLYEVPDSHPDLYAIANWTANDTFYYLLERSASSLPLTYYNITNRTTTTTDLATLPWQEENPLTADSELFTLISTPQNPDHIFALFTNKSEYNNVTLIHYDLKLGQAEKNLDHIAFYESSRPLFSPDGRWFSFLYQSNDDRNHNLFLYDTINNVTRISPAHQQQKRLNSAVKHLVWSADSQWLAVPTFYTWQLYAPQHNYIHQFIHGLNECHSPVWVE